MSDAKRCDQCGNFFTVSTWCSDACLHAFAEERVERTLRQAEREAQEERRYAEAILAESPHEMT